MENSRTKKRGRFLMALVFFITSLLILSAVFFIIPFLSSPDFNFYKILDECFKGSGIINGLYKSFHNETGYNDLTDKSLVYRSGSVEKEYCSTFTDEYFFYIYNEGEAEKYGEESLLNKNVLKDYLKKNEQIQEQPVEKPEIQQKPQDCNKQPEQSEASQSTSTLDYTPKMLSMINKARAEHGLPLSSLNSSLCYIAGRRCSDMLTRNYFSHVTPEGKNIFTILEENGIGYDAAGENIQNSYPAVNASAEIYFNNWMNSTIHRENILSGNFAQIGIGFSSKDGWFISTLIFLG